VASLTSWATVQARLSLEAEQQATTEHLIAVASRRAEQHAKRTLAADAVTLQLDGTGTRRLDLREWPINSVTSVHVDSDLTFGADTEVTDFGTISERGTLYRQGLWPKGYANVKVVANVGYATVPDDLEESVIQLVSYWLESPQISWLSPQLGGDAQSFQANYTGVLDVPYQIRHVWDMYRRLDT